MVCAAAGDPLEQHIPPGFVDNRIQNALDALGRLIGKWNPEMNLTHAEVPVYMNREIYDLPENIQGVSYVELVNGNYVEAKVERIAASDHLAAGETAPAWFWHPVDGRRIRVHRPVWSVGKDYTPGLRIMGTKRYWFPRDPDQELVLPDAALDWVTYHAARRCTGYPGADPNTNELRVLFAEAEQDLSNAVHWNEVGDFPPVAEDGNRD